jgi:hypothetical protein
MKWNSAFFAFSLIIEGTREKVLLLKMSLKPIFMNTTGKFENNKTSIIGHDFCDEKKL